MFIVSIVNCFYSVFIVYYIFQAYLKYPNFMKVFLSSKYTFLEINPQTKKNKSGNHVTSFPVAGMALSPW